MWIYFLARPLTDTPPSIHLELSRVGSRKEAIREHTPFGLLMSEDGVISAWSWTGLRSLFLSQESCVLVICGKIGSDDSERDEFANKENIRHSEVK